MSAGSLADGFVEIQLKTERMAQEMREVIAETGRTAKAAEEAFNKVANRGVRRATDDIIRQRREYVRLGDEYRKQMGMDRTGGVSTGRLSSVAGYAARGMSLASTVAATATALTFAAAAAAGTTTLDTLTGSIKMLSLAAGAKTQDGVLRISKWIQGLSKTVDKLNPMDMYAGGGLLAGAGIGYRFGGFKGALIGGGIGLGAGVAAGGNSMAGGALAGGTLGAATLGVPGAIGGAAIGALIGYIRDTKFSGDYEKDLAYKMARDPEKAALGLSRAAVMEKQGDAAGADMLRNAVALSEKMRKADPDAFKTAGLGMPGSFSALDDLRKQAQLSVFSPGGELGAANARRELENNQNAMNGPVVQELKGLRQDLKGQDNRPPANMNP